MISMLTPNPEAASIAEAVERYLAEGGTIQRVSIEHKEPPKAPFNTPHPSLKRELIEYKGKLVDLIRLCERHGIKAKTLKSRLARGEDIDKALGRRVPKRPNKAAP